MGAVGTSVWTFGSVGNAYLGLFSAQPVGWGIDYANALRKQLGLGDKQVEPFETFGDKQLIAFGFWNVFIIQVGSAATFNTFENFIKEVSQSRIIIDAIPGSGLVGDAGYYCKYQHPREGWIELDYASDLNVHAFDNSNTEIPLDNFKRFENKYADIPWDADHFNLKFEGSELELDFRNIDQPFRQETY